MRIKTTEFPTNDTMNMTESTAVLMARVITGTLGGWGSANRWLVMLNMASTVAYDDVILCVVVA